MIARALMLTLALAGGATTSQLPEFAQQYRQRLGGAIDALGQVVDGFREDARSHGLTLDEAVSLLSSASDGLVRAQGERMGQTVRRLERLEAQREAMLSAGPFARVGVMMRDLDPALAEATLADFEPGVPVTSEGAVMAGGGFLSVLFGGGLLGRLARRRRSRQA
jgi:hypothetical protein